MLDIFIQGLEILKKHTKNPEWADVHGAQHDLIVVSGIDVASCTAEEINQLNFLRFLPGEDGDLREVDILLALEEAGIPIEEGQYFEWDDLSDAQWNVIKTLCHNDCFTYYS